MVTVTKERLARDLAVRLQTDPEQAIEMVEQIFATIRRHLRAGNAVEIDDLCSIAVSNQALLREDESGGLAAYAPGPGSLEVTPVGSFKKDLAHLHPTSIYYLGQGNDIFAQMLGEHFGRKGWELSTSDDTPTMLRRLDSDPPVAVVLESKIPGWEDLIREVKCNPLTNGVPVVGIFKPGERESAALRLHVEPDDIIIEPFNIKEFIQTAGVELAARVATPQEDIFELTLALPGHLAERKRARELVEEVLYRNSLPEDFVHRASWALHEALDNAVRYGHCGIECCTIQVRLILDPRRLLLAVRDSGKGYDHSSVLANAREAGNAQRDFTPSVGAVLPENNAVGGLARILRDVDRIEFNRNGNEIVITKYRPRVLVEDPILAGV